MKIESLLKNSTRQLKEVSDSAILDCEILLLHALNTFSHNFSHTFFHNNDHHYNRAFLRSHPEIELAIDQLTLFNLCIEERLKGKPIAYITGFKEFWSLKLQLNEHTLIPRPETELLVEKALELITDNVSWNILDLGTGSGAIALAIASERKNCRVFASDKSFPALVTAKNNALRLNINNCYFMNGNWLKAIKNNMFHIIVSNPPYIKENDPHLKQTNLQYEPISALVSKNNGLNDLKKIIQSARTHLLEPAHILVEHGYDQAHDVNKLFQEYNYQNCTQVKDINGITRVSLASSNQH